MQPNAPSPPPLWRKIAPTLHYFMKYWFWVSNKKCSCYSGEQFIEPLIGHPHLSLWGKVVLPFCIFVNFWFSENFLDKNCFSYSEKEFRNEMQLISPSMAPLWIKQPPIDVFREISSSGGKFQSKNYSQSFMAVSYTHLTLPTIYSV